MYLNLKGIKDSINSIIIFIIIFCYVFAFYVLNVSISILICFPLYAYAAINKEFFRHIILVLKSRYLKNVIVVWFVLLFMSILYPLIFLTFDLSLFSLILTQFIHLVAALPVFAFLSYKDVTFSKVEKIFVWIFVLQTIIQLVVILNPALVDLIRLFNHFDEDKVGGPGANIRGMALSAATTYHLSLVYGAAFIIYVKVYLSEKISIKNLILGFLLFIGIFFTGRTAFVGVSLALVAYLFSSQVSFINRFKLFVYVPLAVIILLALVSLISPDFRDMLDKDILPYAFEFYYKMEEGGTAETASTNQLQDMWASDFNPIELLVGSGNYTNSETGGYYMKVDPGILRHLLFMGVIGYFVILLYQLTLFPVWKMDKETRYYYLVILVYFIIMEFKGVTLGVNKFVLSTSILLYFSYFELKRK